MRLSVSDCPRIASRARRDGRLAAVGVEEHLGPAHDPRERRPDLVREVREEVVLEAVAPLELLDEARVAERDRALLGEERERRAVLRA